jgi:hypothetical protein
VLAALDAEQDLVALSVPVCEAVFPALHDPPHRLAELWV